MIWRGWGYRVAMRGWKSFFVLSSDGWYVLSCINISSHLIGYWSSPFFIFWHVRTKSKSYFLLLAYPSSSRIDVLETPWPLFYASFWLPIVSLKLDHSSSKVSIFLMLPSSCVTSRRLASFFAMMVRSRMEELLVPRPYGLFWSLWFCFLET